jgi:hypothetical protein
MGLGGRNWAAKDWYLPVCMRDNQPQAVWATADNSYTCSPTAGRHPPQVCSVVARDALLLHAVDDGARHLHNGAVEFQGGGRLLRALHTGQGPGGGKGGAGRSGDSGCSTMSGTWDWNVHQQEAGQPHSFQGCMQTDR